MKEYLKGLNFYEIKFQKTFMDVNYSIRICTYRDQETVELLFGEQKKKAAIYNFYVIKLDTDWILEEEDYWFPMFCVELKNTYIDLKSLIEDILIGKLTGLIDIDLDAIWGLDE